LDPNEKLLFHGTSNTNPEIIYSGINEAFDITFCNDSSMWGKGLYFAETGIYIINFDTF